MENLEAAAQRMGPGALIGAHSLGCLLVAHWLLKTSCKIRGALMVAVPNPEGPNFPTEALGFAPVPDARFDCPSIVVASTDDPYGGLRFSQQCAEKWGSRLVDIGPAGHINAASGLGAWSEGQSLLRSIC
jgi:predicted alpha/beta hydrolase family esterase